MCALNVTDVVKMTLPVPIYHLAWLKGWWSPLCGSVQQVIQQSIKNLDNLPLSTGSPHRKYIVMITIPEAHRMPKVYHGWTLLTWRGRLEAHAPFRVYGIKMKRTLTDCQATFKFFLDEATSSYTFINQVRKDYPFLLIQTLSEVDYF